MALSLHRSGVGKWLRWRWMLSLVAGVGREAETLITVVSSESGWEREPEKRLLSGTFVEGDAHRERPVVTRD